MVQLCPKLDLKLAFGWIGQKEKRGGFGKILRKGVVEDEGVVARLVEGHIIMPLGYFVRFIPTRPVYLFHTNRSHLVYYCAGSRLVC